LFWEELFVGKTLLNVDNVSHSVSVGAVQLFPGPVDLVRFDNLAVRVDVFLVTEVDTFLGSFDSSNE